jgi:hypothetical protein
MSKILLIADNPIGLSSRGAESCDAVIYSELKPDFQTCQEFNENPRVADKYIVSNFASLSSDSQNILISRGNVVHISHDFLFVGSRNPAQYVDFKVQSDHLINVEFLKSVKIFCQSSLQESIFKLNGFENAESWGGNLWTEEDLVYLVSLAGNPKRARAAVIDHPYKGTPESIELCERLRIPFDTIAGMDYYSFLSVLSHYSTYVYVPALVPETFGRILIEAKIMGTTPITDWRCGAVHEECYKLDGAELAKYMNEKREEILTKLKA